MVSLSLTGSGKGLGLPSPLPEFKPVTLQDTQRELLERTVFGRDRGASIVEFSENVFRLKLEKHIDDYEDGHGNFSSRTGGEVQGRHLETSYDLNSIDPSAAVAYSGYSGAFSYGDSARFKAGVNQASQQVQRISASYDQKDALTEYYGSIVEQVEQTKKSANQEAESNKVDIEA